MVPLLFLALITLANGLCLGGVLLLRQQTNRRSERQEAFLQRWRPVIMQWSLGHPVPFPQTQKQGHPDASFHSQLNRSERLWFLALWNKLHESLRGNASAYLNGLLDQMALRQDLSKLLKSRDLEEQLAAVQAIGHLQTPEFWDDLVVLALKTDSMLSFQALRALLVISSEAALPVLIDVLRTHRDWSRMRLLGTLRRIPSPRLVQPLGSAMLAALQEGDQALARDLLLLLGVLRYPSILPYLHKVLALAPSTAMLDISAQILGEMRDATALPALETLLAHPDAILRKQVLQAIGKMAGAAQIPALLQVLKDPDWWVVYHAIEALHQIPGIRPEKLAEFYKHPLPQVRDAMNYYQESANLNERTD